MNDVKVGLVCFRLIGSNQLNQKLLTTINASGRLHMVGDKNGVDNGDFDVGWIWRWLQVPASVNDFFVIRFAVCAEKANEKDIGEFGFNFASFCVIFSVREPDHV